MKLKCLLWDVNGTKWSPIRDGYAKLYLYNDDEFYIVDTVADNFYGRDSHCCFIYDHTGNTQSMLDSCGIDKKKFSDEKETMNWVRVIREIVNGEKDIHDGIKEYVTTHTEIITSDMEGSDIPDKCISLDKWHEIMSRDITFDSSYLNKLNF